MICKNCGYESEGRFCSNCGESMHTHRVSMHHLLHETIHTFTHLDKGFGYTLKKLVTEPGRTQRLYLEGYRARHQKPFSMFFICATISALCLYWIARLTREAVSPEQEAVNYFLQHYYVLLHIALFPLYTLVTWLLFIKSKYNYAELLVLGMYQVAFMLLLLIPVNLIYLLLPFPHARVIEIIVISIYNIWTFVQFFNKTPKLTVIFLSIINAGINFFAFSFIMEWIIIHVLMKSSH